MQAISRDDVIWIMRAKQGSRSLREFGKAMGCSAAYLSDIYADKRNPGKSILNPLGLTAIKTTTITYTKKKRATR